MRERFEKLCQGLGAGDRAPPLFTILEALHAHPVRAYHNLSHIQECLEQLDTHERLATIPVGRGPDWLTFTPDSKRVFISNAGSNSVSVIDVATHKELRKIPVGKIPKRIITVQLP